jgi:regulator of nonsense transcripts 2
MDQEKENNQNIQNNGQSSASPEAESKDIKFIKEKVKEKIAKDKQRVAIRTQNMNKFKKYDMMDFEKTKWEIIQKSSKKFSKITEENKNELLEDIEKYNFQKILEEIIKNIIDSKFDFKDVNAIILVLSELNQIYDKFDVKYVEYLKKHLADFNDTLKIPARNEEEEERKNQRRKVLLRLFIESYLYGFINDFNQVKDVFVSLISPKNPKEQFFQDFPILVNLMRVFGEPLFGIKSKSIKSAIDKGEMENYELNIIVPKEQIEKYYTGFRNYYYKLVLTYLEEEHKILVELEKKNFENMKRLDSNNDVNTAYMKQRSLYLKFIQIINEFAEIMDFEIPELANEKTFRYEEQKKTEMKLEKINKYDPFSDEVEYLFYTQPLNVKEKVSSDVIERILNRNMNDSNLEGEELLDTNEKRKKFDNLISKILKCDSTETIDEATLEFLNNPVFLSYRYRKSVIKAILRSSKSNLAVLKYFARFTANLSPLYKDMPTETSTLLMEDFNDLNKEEKLGMFEEKIKNIRFISEMVKFELFPMQNIFEILKRLIDDFKGHSIDLLCQLMESCGRFLYLNEVSHLKFNTCLEAIKQYAHHRMRHDERAFNSILNCIQVCKPQESTLRKKVKVRPIEEEYIRYLIFHSLSKDTIRRTAILLRRFDWNNWEHVIFKVIYKFLNRGNENQIKYCCAMLSLLKDHHPNLINNLVNTILEEIRIGLDRNDFNDNQHKILMCLLCSNFYTYKLINSDLIFYVLYMILTYNPEWNSGRRELLPENPLDMPSDTFRMQMIISILDLCGQHLNTGSKKERLYEFLHFLQLYILSKQYLPLDVENRVTTCLENLYEASNYHVYTDFTVALKDAKKYKGLNFELDDEELNSQEKKPEHKFDPNDFNRSKKEIKFIYYYHF